MRTPRIIACSIIASGALLLPTAASAAPPATTAPPRLQEAAFTSPQRGYGLFDQVGAKMCRAEVAVTAIGQAELVRTSKATGYVLTGPDVNPRGKPDAAKILITRNGGRFWSRHAVQCGLDGQTAALAVAPRP